MHAHGTVELDRSKVETLKGLSLPSLALIAGGAIVLIAAFMLSAGSDGVATLEAPEGAGKRHFFFSYLVSFWFFLTISLGAFFLTALQHLTRSGWGVVVRRFMELLAQGVIPMAVLFVPILMNVLVGSDLLYPWNNPERMANDSMLVNKIDYFAATWWTVRSLLCLATWVLLARWFLGMSARQDQSGDPELTNRMEGMAAPTMLLFAVSITFAAIDWVMSLDPYWYSTIWGVYFFAGSVLSCAAVLCLAVVYFRLQGWFKGLLSVEHQHEVGRVMFFATCFWAYIAFSQYLLYWYANIPEETHWYHVRQSHGWGYFAIVLIVGHFAVPFVGFMSRQVKRTPHYLACWAGFMLLMHYCDLYWLIMPNFSATDVPLGWLELATFVGIGSIWAGSILKLGEDYPLLPVRDPRLTESVHFHNL